MFASLSTALLRNGWRTMLILLAVMSLCGCEAIAGALPPSPSPFPTLARLPSVTPAPPSPTPAPTLPPVSDPMPVALEVTVAVGANVRAGPGITFAIVGSVVAGGRVTLRGQRDGWYQVTTSEGTEGWMVADVLDLPPQAATLVPYVEP